MVTVPGNSSSATIGGLDQNSQYSVTVSGRTVAGDGDFSNATVVPLPAQSTGIKIICMYNITLIFTVHIKYKLSYMNCE